MRQKLTLKSIAKKFGVSISTVSKALKDSYEISEEKRIQIQQYAKAHNYRPNNIAISLKNQKSHSIGVIIPELVHHFFSEVILGIETIANEKGFHVIICVSNNSYEKEVLQVDMLTNGSCDGMILSLAKATQAKQDFRHIQEVIDQGVPVVLFDRVSDQLSCDQVFVNDLMASYEATQMLLNDGRKKIGLITTVDYISVGRQRTMGYQQALSEAQMDTGPILKIEHMDDIDIQIPGYIHKHDLDAILTVNEEFAVTALKALRRKGLKVPEDVSIIAFADGILSKFSHPPLTTVSQHAIEMGRTSAELLLGRIMEDVRHPDPIIKVVPTSIIRRSTT